jgi:Tetracyclin repressor-like, C-terminal domain
VSNEQFDRHLDDVLRVRAALTSRRDDAIERAIARGEVEAGQISDRVARLPVDLFRHELLMTLKPVSDKAIEEIVDTIFLPLVRLGAP